MREMPLQDQASIWSDLAIKTLDVSSGVVPPGGVLSEKELTANLLLLAGGGQGRLVMNGGDCRIQAFLPAMRLRAQPLP